MADNNLVAGGKKMITGNRRRIWRIRRTWQGFWQLADPKVWLASTVPMFVGAALTYANTRTVSSIWFVVALVAIYLIEIGKNAVNEVVDYHSGVDQYTADHKRNVFSGGKKTIIDGILSIKEVTVIAIAALSGALGIGMIIGIWKEPAILWIGLAGLMIAVFYSLPPFKFIYHGLGEAAVGITYGPLLLSGVYLLLNGTVDWKIIAVGCPIAFLIANVLWVNQYPDYEADLLGGKRNWLVRIGKEKGLRVYAGLYFAAYASFIMLAIVFQNPFWLLGWTSFPLAWQSVQIARKHMNEFPQFYAANTKTIQIYFITGIAMTIAALVHI